MTGYRGKRCLDLLLGVPALVVSLPVQAAIALVVRGKLGAPVLFRQRRPGLHGEPFEMIKFRTMLPVDADRGLVSDESRMTGVGRFLRATSLDELPTLWHLLTGRMSLVGPRPLLMQYLDRYSPEQARRHDVRPGLTGLAQINGRNAIAWEDRLRLDVEYVDTVSLRLDLRILARTVGQVLAREGIAAEGSSTMPEFTGSAGKEKS
ncbi:MAG: sugar transferase [Tetrasphaera sp.]